MQVYAFLSPVPWFSDNSNNALLKFYPYQEPYGYVPPNACQPGQLSNSTVFRANISHPLPRDEPLLRFRRFADSAPVAPELLERDTNIANYSQAAIWIGALGSCNRDLDGKVYCTQPSYSNPEYNLTHVQANSVFFPAMLPDVIHRRLILATIALNAVGYLFYFLGSLPFWFPGAFSSCCGAGTKDGSQQSLAVLAGTYLFLSCVTQFFMNFCLGVTRTGQYNSIDNFYNPAPCGQTRQLKSGILLKAGHGRLYNMIWGGWCLIFLFAVWFLVWRIAWLNDNFANSVSEYNSRGARKAAKKEEKARAKEEKKFRKEVEKEKIAMAAREELEKEKKLTELEENKSIGSDDSDKTLASLT